MLRAWLNSVEQEAFHRLMRGKPLQGFKLVQGRTNRAWKDPKKVMKALIQAGLSQEEVSPRTLVSPAQAERLIRARKLQKKWVKIETLITRPQGKVSIAPSHDPRQAVTRGSEFKGVTVDMED